MLNDSEVPLTSFKVSASTNKSRVVFLDSCMNLLSVLSVITNATI